MNNHLTTGKYKDTLQEVKEYFKNAKEVKCNEYKDHGKVYEIDFETIRYIKEKSTQVICNSIKNDTAYVSLYNRDKYSEIISYKEPLYQLTAKEVVHAYENPQYLKDTFKECFETELEVGRWYKNPNRKAIMYFETITNNTCFGYGFDNSGIWENKLEYFCNNWEPATEKEVEEALVKEARKRYKVGDNIFQDNKIHSITKDLFLSLVWFVGYNTLEGGANGLNDNTVLFNNGTWAEIIQVPTYTILEAEEKFNIKIIKNEN